MRQLIAILIFCFSISAYAIENPYPFTSPADAERFAALTQEVRCVVCQNQSIADSYAPLAADLREKIYRMVLDQQSNQAIEDYLVKRYGEFILLRPRFHPTTWILWLFPALGLIVAATLFMLRLKHASSGKKS